MQRLLQLVVLLPFLIPSAHFAVDDPKDTTPPDFRYRELQLEGWKVFVEQELAAEADLCGEVERQLGVKLWEVRTRLPAEVVERLQAVPIRLHLDREGCPGGVYHPSADWLRQHDLPPDWARGIEFGNARNFLSWSRAQPSMVLHELSHAWHHQVLDYGRKDVLAAFAAVRDAGTLDEVLYVTGGTQRAYALNNEMEFFAEMSEAWWGTNDFYPFVAAEVQDAFPEVAGLMVACWK